MSREARVLARVVALVRTDDNDAIKSSVAEDIVVASIAFAYHMRANGAENACPRQVLDACVASLPDGEAWDLFYASLVFALSELPD